MVQLGYIKLLLLLPILDLRLEIHPKPHKQRQDLIFHLELALNLRPRQSLLVENPHWQCQRHPHRLDHALPLEHSTSRIESRPALTHTHTKNQRIDIAISRNQD